jgi:pyruvate/2-oxoacid:ferredoxin oxidoreductase alpha subunit
VGGVYVQAESEVASINMVLGGGSTGYRVMTSSSSPGISLMSEGISYVAGCEIPAVIVNVMRAGPGLGGILPGQADYLQSTKGGGNGDYNLIVLAPSTLQECVDFTQMAFDLAEKYRNPVMVAAVAEGLKGAVREQDTVARLGGDEFITVLDGFSSPEEIDVLLSRINGVFSNPFIAGNRPISIRASLGAAIFPDDGTTADQLIAKADELMYARKLKGRGGSR